jgi:hypothetical protein
MSGLAIVKVIWEDAPPVSSNFWNFRKTCKGVHRKGIREGKKIREK